MSFARGFKAGKKGIVEGGVQLAEDRSERKEDLTSRNRQNRLYAKRRLDELDTTEGKEIIRTGGTTDREDVRKSYRIDLRKGELDAEDKSEKKLYRRQKGRETRDSKKVAGKRIAVQKNTTNRLVSNARLTNR